ncbi:hypothetical protein PCL_05616 [Purpureocillium lilacinum]|uniref:Uncharacterized protein n=1 Tax=Purpureocillium lilacinum TaxID=33203 RepID=A0A2U3DUG1_PURLI|nr:hypothetical protein PCL_05616 [Purpureocillium lilacinum]
MFNERSLPIRAEVGTRSLVVGQYDAAAGSQALSSVSRAFLPLRAHREVLLPRARARPPRPLEHDAALRLDVRGQRVALPPAPRVPRRRDELLAHCLLALMSRHAWIQYGVDETNLRLSCFEDQYGLFFIESVWTSVSRDAPKSQSQCLYIHHHLTHSLSSRILNRHCHQYYSPHVDGPSSSIAVGHPCSLTPLMRLNSGVAGATRLPPNTRAGLLASRAALVGRGRRFGSSDPGSVATESHHHWRTESSYANASASAMQPTPSDLQQHSEAFTEGGAHLRVS